MMDDFNRAILDDTAHRPWPMPSSAWIMTQTWHDLLFAHWPVDAAALRERVPPAFELDLFDGQAWLGVVPFHMTNVAPRFVPAIPGISAFPELNVRTYVTVGGKPGVYFFSLDAGSSVAVGAAKTLLNLPYFVADMTVTPRDGDIHYHSRRVAAPHAEFRAIYRGLGDRRAPAPRTLEHFLTERYCLYAVTRAGRLRRAEIHHPVWPLQGAEVDIRLNSMTDGLGIQLAASDPVVHFAERLEVYVWLPETLGDLRRWRSISPRTSPDASRFAPRA